MIVISLLVAVLLIQGLLWAQFQAFRRDNQKQEPVAELLGTHQKEIRRDLQEQIKDSRSELSQIIRQMNDSQLQHMTQLATLQKNQLDSLRETVEKRLASLQDDNNKKLEQMRSTVDEKLHATLEKRLGESFKQVSDRLEMVHKGLGEMQTLASGVGDLKKVLTNVKTRGTWGEVQLAALLEQVLVPEQYEANVKVRKNSQDFVEYVIKLPGREEGVQSQVWLPIDAKFPLDLYQHLVTAEESGDPAAVTVARKNLITQIKKEARTIRDKYISPPQTTDFAILFLPTEALFAEVLRQPGLLEALQHDYRVSVAGPTTLAALLNSLQMGFRTLAIEKRSSEVWSILAKVKTEFGKFGDILDKTQKKLQEAGNTIETAARKSRNIQQKLNKVQDLPSADREPADFPLLEKQVFTETPSQESLEL